MKIISLFIFIIFLSISTVYAQVVCVAGVPGTKAGFEYMLAQKGKDPLELNDYRSSFSNRPVISLIMIQQALHAGGMNVTINFISFPNHARSISEVKNGTIPILASDMWESDFDESVYKTDPFIRKGEFEKGIYTIAESDLQKGTCDLARLQKFTPLTENSWGTDIQVLKNMKFKIIQTAPRYDLLFKMMSHKRADFILLEFSSESSEMVHRHPSGNLYPVEGIKVVFPFSRHFMVSKKHPDGKRIYDALQKGLEILRNKGTIEKALYQSGLKLKKVRYWKVIYPQQDNYESEKNRGS